MLDELKAGFSGELYYKNSVAHNSVIMSYATDASVYQERPIAVAIPKTIDDIQSLIRFANEKGLSIIPRAAGTSLAGQVVGNGIVADISKYFTSILEVNSEHKWVRVQPGVIRDDLNVYLKPYGLMFGPETSTSNRAMIGGMIGNNSSGLHSIIWGDTRANIVEIKAILYDGTEVVFNDLSEEAFYKKCAAQSPEGEIYKSVKEMLTNPINQQAIEKGFPKKSIHRRNTGYALDSLLEMFQFKNNSYNLSKLIAGSEGTLCFITEATLKLRNLPPKEKCIVAVHTHSIKEALNANLVALQHKCSASELVDYIILEFTKTNIDQSKNRFFIEGEPKAILMVEFFNETIEALNLNAASFIQYLQFRNLGYAYPVLYGTDTDKAWDLRKAGLGLLRNEPGDTQPVNLIEDCAVDAEDLPNYIDDVEALLKTHHIKYSMYAHAGAGELHVEPMINLKTSAGKKLFRTVLQETVAIVKKYNGSLSGEHGDGRLRGEFIPEIMGETNYALFRQVKKIFDPNCIFNKGKIVDTPPMNEFLRYHQDMAKKEIKTVFDFATQEGILHLAEKCSGSGDCRKTHISGGVMCPSYMATRSERDTTRARANMLRHFYTNQAYDTEPLTKHEEVRDVLDLCLSCKGCKSECPSGVDVGKMKAEFTQQYYDKHGVPLRSKLIGNFTSQMAMASVVPWAYNLIFKTTALRRIANKMVGFHPDRSMPLLQNTTLRKWFVRHKRKMTGDRWQLTDVRRKEAYGNSNISEPVNRQLSTVILFCDEFTNYNDVETGKKTILLLESLGYDVLIPEHLESGRTYLSKGLIIKAKEIAIKNVELLKDVVNTSTPIIGIEPSAILTLRDEYPELVPFELLAQAKQIAKNTFLFEEWFANEIDKGNIQPHQFISQQSEVYIHGHCHQKALSSTTYIKRSLSVISNYHVHEIASGCCGMAGSFGYESEHYDVSMKIGGLVLFPTINKLSDDVILAASGTSCRHQIKDGTGRVSKHSAEILYEALMVHTQHTR